MNSERHTATTPSQGRSANQPAALRSECYLATSPMSEVMVDQLEYLLAHTGQGCAPECMDCGRLQQVKNWLLLPFHSAPHGRVQ